MSRPDIQDKLSLLNVGRHRPGPADHPDHGALSKEIPRGNWNLIHPDAVVHRGAIYTPQVDDGAITVVTAKGRGAERDGTMQEIVCRRTNVGRRVVTP